MRGGPPPNPGDVTLPPPSLLGIADPVADADAKHVPRTASVPTKRIAWHPIPPPRPPRGPVRRANRSQDRPRLGSRAARLGWQLLEHETALRTVKAAPADQTTGTRGQ